ncbi:MBL fold metallo-hydrolase [Candidatus Bathyarchaeota archaeon]|nr:MBL fold metallo-hydrolase [Candidatus Bathyarchaeota archaeon]
MILEKIKSRVVAHLSYFLGSGYEAMVVDPQRDCQVYIDTAKREGMRIKYVFETHRNEDYVIGSRELSHLTGAEIYHGPWPEFKYGETLRDGQEFHVGKLKLTALHTPGHTPGCMSYAATDLATGGDTVIVFTGDTLFVGDTGRTDFGGPEKRREWSENLYDSIHGKLLPLGDHVVMCPAHGSGSVCGSGIADRELSTLGAERLMNPFLRMSKQDFIDYKVNEHHHYTPYFHMMEKLNVIGAPFLGCGPNPEALTPQEFKKMANAGGVVVDTRPPPSFGAGHIKDSYSISTARLGMGGWVLPYDKPLLLVLGGHGELDYVSRSLARMGYDNISGYLTGTIASWYTNALPVETLNLITVAELKHRISKENMMVLDVRSLEEYGSGHIEGSKHIYAGTVEQHGDKVPRDRPVAVICKSGTRSGFASSMLLRMGYRNIYNVLGGMTAWGKAGYPVAK